VTAAGIGGAAALAHFLPSTLVLPTFMKRPPASLGTWCRWRSSSGRAQVAITFDDGPSEHTETTRQLLERVGMPGTFFVTGEQLSRYPDTVKDLEASGHEVASHGFAHTSALLMRPARVRANLERAVDIHRSLLGRSPRFYRPPFGHVTASTLREVRRQHLELALWSVWARSSPTPARTRCCGGSMSAWAPERLCCSTTMMFRAHPGRPTSPTGFWKV
jgi:peptidoglycan/xylan/chitin deacetylase (PgdA/CDA1 family)